jgi:PTS system nitrogen regulatory IIA component
MQLGIEDIAKCLDLPATTVDRWIRQGRIPVQRRGDACDFEISALKRWAASKRLPFRLPKDPAARDDTVAEDALVSLETAMRRGGIFHDVPGADVRQVLTAAVENITGIAPSEKNALLQALIDREELTSTGIGNGVAIPHPRTPLAETLTTPQITTCFLSRAIDFHAVDDRPVFVLFLLISDSVQTHLHLLSRLAYGLRDKSFIDVLKTKPDAASLLAHIADFEHRLDHASPL